MNISRPAQQTRRSEHRLKKFGFRAAAAAAHVKMHVPIVNNVIKSASRVRLLRIISGADHRLHPAAADRSPRRPFLMQTGAVCHTYIFYAMHIYMIMRARAYIGTVHKIYIVCVLFMVFYDEVSAR